MMPKGVYAGRVGVRKNYRHVEWEWKVEYSAQEKITDSHF